MEEEGKEERTYEGKGDRDRMYEKTWRGQGLL